MSELIKKTILAGLGVLSFSQEKAKEIAKDLVRRGELAKTEEAKFVKDLMEKAEKRRVEMEKKMEKTVEKVLVKLNIPTRKELNELKTKLDKVAKQ
jgi:poly(hydroxyalkanoate) granule-associated protein